MKKVIAVLLALIMVFSMSVAVCTEDDGFVVSPSKKNGPILISFENESDDCTATIERITYADRDLLPSATRALLEYAYGMIKANPDLSVLNEDLKDVAKKYGVDVKDLAVSDLFDISAEGCDTHEDHGHFNVVLEPDSLKNFVALLHYYEGEWRIVDGAKVTNNGDYLEFYEKEFSPFAIVVSTTTVVEQPVDSAIEELEAGLVGNNSSVFAVVAAVSGLLLLLLAFGYKKIKA